MKGPTFNTKSLSSFSLFSNINFTDYEMKMEILTYNLMRSSRDVCCPVPKFRIWPWYCYRSLFCRNVKPVLLSTVWCCVRATTFLLSQTRLSMILKQLQSWQFIDICFPVTIKSSARVPMTTGNNATVLNCIYLPYDLLIAPLR